MVSKRIRYTVIWRHHHHVTSVLRVYVFQLVLEQVSAFRNDLWSLVHYVLSHMSPPPIPIAEVSEVALRGLTLRRAISETSTVRLGGGENMTPPENLRIGSPQDLKFSPVTDLYDRSWLAEKLIPGLDLSGPTEHANIPLIYADMRKMPVSGLKNSFRQKWLLLSCSASKIW